ncbi:hypothetical protein JCM10296v2_001150 [Rhodotorula toruloides]
MPFLSLPGGVRMHYEILTDASAAAPSTSSTSSLLDPSKPTLVSLVPFCVPQATDIPQLRPTSPLHATHNIVAFSPRSHGRTVSESKPSHDPFVSAADLAFAFEALQLPPSQLYAPGSICGRIGVAFTILFPNLVTALSLVGISGREAKTSTAGFKTLDSAMFDPEEAEDLHETLAELSYSLWGDHLTTDEFDAFINLLLRRHNPRMATRSYELCRISYLSVNLTPEALAGIRQPVLILHGEEDRYNDASVVGDWRRMLTGAKSVEAHVIPDSPHMCFITAHEPVTYHLSSFLRRHLPPYLPTYTPPAFSSALETVSKLFNSPKARLRNPRNPESYSSLSDADKEEVRVDLERMRRYEREWATKPLLEGAEGVEPWELETAERIPRPKWRWSRRHDAYADSPRHSQARFSVASEVFVQVASVQSAEKIPDSKPFIRPMSIAEVKVLPPLPVEDEESDSDSSSEDEDSGWLGRKDSGFVDAFEVLPDEEEKAKPSAQDAVDNVANGVTAVSLS